MSEAAYTRYRSRRTSARKPLMAPVPPRDSHGGGDSGPSGLRRRHPRSSGLWLVRITTRLVIFAGVAAFIYAGWTFGYGYYNVRVGQEQLRSQYSFSGSASVDADYLLAEATAMAANLDYLEPVGEISIPGIDSRWMIVEGSDDFALTRGPGHIEETAIPGMGGNFAVAGDRVLYGAPFLNLDDVAVGDEITVRMAYATFVYRVTETFIVTPEDVSVLQPPGYEAITLLTCDPPWDIKQRIVIRGRLEQTLSAGSGS